MAVELRIDWYLLDFAWSKMSDKQRKIAVFQFIQSTGDNVAYIDLRVAGTLVELEYIAVRRSDRKPLTKTQVKTIKQLVKLRYGCGA